MKRRTKVLLIVLAIGIVSVSYGFYLLHKKPADVRKLSADFSISAATIVNAFSDNEQEANKKYLDKVIDVKGKVADIKLEANGNTTLFLDSGNPLASVTCSFYNDEAASVKSVKKGDEVIVKGMCTGFLMDVVLNKCSIVN